MNVKEIMIFVPTVPDYVFSHKKVYNAWKGICKCPQMAQRAMLCYYRVALIFNLLLERSKLGGHVFIFYLYFFGFYYKFN